MINLRHGKGTRADDRIPLRAMGPAFFNEYEARADYYDAWLATQLAVDEIPDSPQARHRRIIELREKAYDRLCDVVYREKGYNAAGVPLPDTLERLGILDDQARELLKQHGVMEQERQLSN
jgi:hypothetical protein